MASETVLTYKQNDYIWIVCKKSVYIRQLRRSGPIIAPLKVKMSTAYSIVCSGIELIQFCPVTYEYAKMTVKNAYRVDKFPKYHAILLQQQASQDSEEETEETSNTESTAATMSLRTDNGTDSTESTTSEETPADETVEVSQNEEVVEGEVQEQTPADETAEESEESSQNEFKSSGKNKKKKK